MEKIIAVIPARYASTRFPGKPLAQIRNKPMIQWVYESTQRAKSISKVLVATDDERIAQVVRNFGGEAILTSTELQSGTDRVAAVADQVPGDIYVNIQGDEPLIIPEAIEKPLAWVMENKFPLCSVMTPIRNRSELTDPSVVKVICDRVGRAIYFSRYPIPYSRGPVPEEPKDYPCLRHVGIYVYRKETLMHFRSLKSSDLEKGELLEQLRALENGIPIGVVKVDFLSIGVDIPEDLEKISKCL
jgi:3-deoxy-manno-octulosonate cytidylyltransferase (CMP-KDO synthetase)